MSLYTLVLAAGEGRRFGQAVKQLAVVSGQTMLEHCVCNTRVITPGKVCVVLGYQHDILRPLVESEQIVINPNWRAGIGNSIACGVAALPSTASAVLIVLCDQVALTAADFMLLCNRYQQLLDDKTSVEVMPIVCAAYAEGLGVPAIFPQRFFNQLTALEGDCGAKKLLLTNSVMSVLMERAAIDIDTQDNWVQFNKLILN